MAAIEWFRLWHDMPNDPKWRTIARISGQPISLVLSVALHLMVDASRNVTRGHVTVTAEDVASALDVTDDVVETIFKAMQGRILDGDRLSGWEKRQPKREDAGNPETGAKSAAERKRAQRQREKEAKEYAENINGHNASRNVTLDKDTDKDSIVFPDGNTSADAPEQPTSVPDDDKKAEKLPRALGVRELVAEGVDRKCAEDWLKVRNVKRAPLTQTAWDEVKAEAEKAGITPGEAVRVSAANSWQGFKASWLAKLGQEGQGHPPRGQVVGTHGGYENRDYGKGGAL